MSEILDAAYNAVHEYPGGARSLAPRLGKAETTLCHEVMGTGTAKLGLLDAAKITNMAKDLRILNAFAANCQCLVIPMPITDDDGCNVMQHVAAASRDFAALVGHVIEAQADKVITTNELHEAERLWGVLVSQGQSVMGLLRAQHAAGVPVHLRTLEG